jgi:hypothetical protein
MNVTVADIVTGVVLAVDTVPDAHHPRENGLNQQPDGQAIITTGLIQATP